MYEFAAPYFDTMMIGFGWVRVSADPLKNNATVIGHDESVYTDPTKGRRITFAANASSMWMKIERVVNGQNQPVSSEFFTDFAAVRDKVMSFIQTP